MAGEGVNEPVFTVKEWLQSIDNKQDKFDEKLDKALETMDRKADARDLRDLQNRTTIIEQQEAARVSIYDRLQKQVEHNSGRLDSQSERINNKAEKSDFIGLQRVLIGTLSGSAIAILAWSLTLFVR